MKSQIDRAWVFGIAASGGVVVITLVISASAARSGGDIGPPSASLRSVVVGLLLVLPGIVGLIGALRRDRALLVGAALGCLVVVPLSYAALPYPIPAAMFLFAATDPSCSARRWTWLIGAAIVALALGSFAGLLANTEERCWVAFERTNGLVYQDVVEAETHELGGPGGPIAAGCDGGALTARGVALAGALWIGAVGLAIAAPRPRPRVVA